MIDSIAAGIISNFMTDFIKSCIGLGHRPIPQPVDDSPVEPTQPTADSEVATRRARNHERLGAASVVLSMAFSFLSLLAVAAFLPVLAKSITGQVYLLETRLGIEREIGTFQLGFVAWLLGLPLFWVVQRVTQVLIQFQHENWSNVVPQQAARLFTISCFVVLPFYSAAVVFLLFPTFDLVDSLTYPVGLVVLAFLYAYASRGR